MIGEFDPGSALNRLAGGARSSLGEPAVRSMVAQREQGSNSVTREQPTAPLRREQNLPETRLPYSPSPETPLPRQR